MIETLSIFWEEAQVIRYVLPTCKISPPLGEVTVSQMVGVGVDVTVLVDVEVGVRVGVEVTNGPTSTVADKHPGTAQ